MMMMIMMMMMMVNCNPDGDMDLDHGHDAAILAKQAFLPIMAGPTRLWGEQRLGQAAAWPKKAVAP